jgi:hypothetical protein
VANEILVEAHEIELSGSLSTAGSLVKAVKQNLAGQIAPTGILSKETFKFFVATIVPTGQVVVFIPIPDDFTYVIPISPYGPIVFDPQENIVAGGDSYVIRDEPNGRIKA